MKKLFVFVGMLALLAISTIATEVQMTMPEDKQVFETNNPVLVRFYVSGYYPITCVFEQKGSNRFFETEPDTYIFWPGWYYMWLVNSQYDYHLYNGRYKLQIVCTDRYGNMGESELVKFHVKGDMKWPE